MTKSKIELATDRLSLTIKTRARAEKAYKLAAAEVMLAFQEYEDATAAESISGTVSGDPLRELWTIF